MKLKRIINNVLIVVLIIIISLCGFNILSKKYKYHKDNQAYEKLRQIDEVCKDENKNTINKDSTRNKFIDINSDYKLWINIPDTVIDYPVVQGIDNEFYLKNNFYKEESISGTIFIDSRNSIDEDRNLVLYGHNMKNGSMFTDINKFKNIDFFQNGEIKIIKNNKEHIYDVFSVFIENSYDIDVKFNFKDNDEFIKYVNVLKEKSIYKKEISNYSNIITLYTCSYEFENARTIVIAMERIT